jgi:SAM-dependent methyltransferase
MPRSIFRKLGFDIIRADSLTATFHSLHYLRHNARRLEHLASLRIPMAGMSVLEIGAGIGDHSHYYMDRGCSITITEVRPENLKYLRMRYPRNNVQFLDMEHPHIVDGSPFDIVHCYGVLYHLNDPGKALEFLAQVTRKILLLETCVSFGETEDIHLISEDRADPSQARSGTGCRPTRPWLFKALRDLFEYVYVPKTQPNHEEFPLDWTAPEQHRAPFVRAIFIASRETLANELLTASLISRQVRHE